MKTKRRNYKKDLEEQKKITEDYINHLKRLQADFENYKKRVEKQNSELVKYSNFNLISKFLTLLDDFENCLKIIKKSEDKEPIQGVELIHNKLLSILKEEGLTEIKALNEKFDHDKHEVLQKIESNQDNIVLEEFQKGYMLNNIVIRSSKVKIGISKLNNTKEEKENE